MSFSDVSLEGNIFAPYAFVKMSSVTGFDGTIVSGDGFNIQADDVGYTAPIPEPSTLVLLAIAGFGLVRRRR